MLLTKDDCALACCAASIRDSQAAAALTQLLFLGVDNPLPILEADIERPDSI